MTFGKLKTYGRFLFFTGIGSMILSCCTTNHFGGDDDTGGGAGSHTRVRVFLSMPATASPATYAISGTDENHVETIDVLVFRRDGSTSSGWAYVYKAQGTAISNRADDSSKKQFDVTLYTLTSPQTLVVLANVRNEVEALGDIAIGADKETLLKKLLFTNTGNWNATPEDNAGQFRPFPMWGEKKEVVLTPDMTEITGIQLLRSIARLDVVVSQPIIDAATFQLHEVHVYNSKHTGYIVPDPDLMSTGKATAATIPADAGEYASWNNGTPLSYTVPSTMRNAFERTMYLLEAQAAPTGKTLQATCVVIGAKYGVDTDVSYYRVDFLQAADRTRYKDILRNHHYRINIIKVTGKGYPTADDAFNSKSLFIEAEVQEWNDGDIHVIFDGQYLLTVCPGQFSFPRDAIAEPGEQNKLTIYTDYPAGWSIENIVEVADGTSPATWLSVQEVTNGLPGTAKELWLQVAENTTGSERKARIIVAAGRMRYQVTVKQSVVPEINLFITDTATGNEITELLFASGKDALPAARKFTVGWLPASASPSVTITPGQIAFAYQAGSDVIATGTLPGGTGSRIYTIQPTAIPTANLLDEPFMERVTRVDYTVSNGTEIAARSIYLRQMSYNLVSTTQSVYSMNGDEYAFTVKSNYPWKAEVVQWGDAPGKDVIVQLITTTGSANTTTGVQVKFRTANDMIDPYIYLGTARVKFTCLLDESVTETVSLLCASGVVQNESNSYLVQPGGKGILIPVSRANAEVTTERIDADDVFTSELLWTDHPGGVSTTAAIRKITVAGQGKSGYILVTPGPAEGNSVITVKVGTAIKWSWHIWVTAYDGSTTKSNNGVVFMDRHLGALTGYTTSSNNNYFKTGLLYQWGRKDPTPTGVSGNVEPTLYNAAGVGSTNRITKASGGSLEQSITNPATVYYRGSPTYDWYSANTAGQNNELWGATEGKTVYDPCPVGWRIPQSGAWNGVSTSGATWNGGYTWSTTSTDIGYYPAAGGRSTNGVLFDVNQYGHVWEATTNGINGLSFYFYNGSVNPGYVSYGYRMRGYSVRCVRE